MPARVEQATAADYVRRLELVEGTTTVLWHSVMWQYLTSAEQNEVDPRVAELGGTADHTSRFARLLFEPHGTTDGATYVFHVTLRVWPGEEEHLLGTAVPYGVPVTWS